MRVLTTPNLVPVGTGPGDADIAMRRGLGQWRGLEATPLMRPRLVPVGSPRPLLGAAVAGQGLALLPDTYVAEDIAAGRLIREAAEPGSRILLAGGE